MHTVEPGSKVLVTGANGYIAIWVVRRLLEEGYSVRGTVRTTDKAKYLENYFKSYGAKFEVVVVEDIAQDGAFDNAVKGVDAVEHTASPFHFNAEDPQDLIIPAVNGTVGILKSVLKYGSSVKRVVITSSCAAVLTPTTKPLVFSEKDWNETSVKIVEELGKKADPMAIYRASKTLAEKSAWAFYKEHKSQIQWDIVFINPPFVFGPAIHDISSFKTLNNSLQAWYDNVVSDKPKTKELLTTTNSWVDVRDVAEGHLKALQKEAAGGERIILSGGPYSWQEWLDVANKLSPNPLPSHKLPLGDPSLKVTEYTIQYNVEKAAKILDMGYKTKEETTRDTLEDFAKRGW